MGTPPSPRLTDRRARRIGLELGSAFVVMAIVVYLRSGPLAVAVLGAVAGAMLLILVAARSALIVPIARRWMALGAAISRVTSPIFLTIVYLVVFTPMAWLRRVIGRSPIVRTPESTTYWVPRERRSAEDARRSMERQF
jgi:hypothetical protein